MKTAPHTTKSRLSRSRMPKGWVPWEQLKRDISAGWEHFWRKRDHLHKPTYDMPYFGREAHE